MTKLLERDQEEKDKRTYVSMFYLPEKDVQKVVADRIEIDWDPNRPDNWEAASVFLANVDQNDPFGDRDTAATKSGNRVACHTFRSVPAGDAVILAGLEAGERVVVEGPADLADGDAVEVRER